jgi:uncharacterized protein (TIGR02266 family)
MDQPPTPPKEPRGPVSLRIKFRSASLEQFIERYAVDVSRGGIFIRTREPLAVGTQLRFDFQLQDAAPLLAGEGTVVWIRENDPNRAGVTPGMGVRFDKLTPASQPTLERILADKARREQEAGPSKTAPASGMAVRRPSSTFSALDPAARAPAPPPSASEPPRMGGLSPLAPAAQPRAPQPTSGLGSGSGALPRAAQPTTGSGAIGSASKLKTTENPVPQGIPTLEASGAFGRPRTTTGMGAQRSVPAPSALFEKPTAEDIDRALSVLTEVEGAEPEAIEPVDFSARFRRPTEPQATVPPEAAAPPVVSTTAAAAAIPSDLMKTVRRPTDAQPLVLESSPDVGDALPRRTGTRPLFSGTGEQKIPDQKLPTVPVIPIGGPSPEELEAEADDDGGDEQTTAWQNSGPTKVGGTNPELRALTGSSDELPKAPPPPKPDLPLFAKPDLSPPKVPMPPVEGPAAPPALMKPDFAAAAAAAPTAQKKKGSRAPLFVALLLLAGGGAYVAVKGVPGAPKPAETATAPAAEPAPAAPTAPSAAAEPAKPAEPEKPAEPAKAAEPEKPAEAPKAEAPAGGGTATPSTLRLGSAPPPEAPKATEPAKPAEPEKSASESKSSRKSKRKSAASEEAAPAAVADVSPAAAEAAAEPPKAGAQLKVTTTPSGAEVIIDGNSVGKTPYVGSDVDPGSPHAITLKKDGFEDHERMISGSDWPRAKAGVRTLKVNVKLRSTGGGDAPKPAEAAPAEQPAPGLGTTPTTPLRE